MALLLLLLAASSCSGGPAGPEDDSEGMRLLFIGNSLTYTNDLPGVLNWMFEQASVPVGRIEEVAFPNVGLQDHWADGRARDWIAQGGFDVVVMQQGPSATEGRPSLLEYGQLFAEEIQQAGSRPAMYMVWPSWFRGFDFDGVSDSYRTAAELADALLFPSGEAWRAAWRRDSTLAFYGDDGFHPSRMGTYLAALGMFEQLANLDPRTLPAEIPGQGVITAELAALLQESAREANAEFAR